MTNAAQNVLVLGGTGTIGRATVRALMDAGHNVTCVLRPAAPQPALPDGVTLLRSEVAGLSSAHLSGQNAIVSCMASRSGQPTDAWHVDHALHSHVLEAAKQAGVTHFVLLSAICVQKPLLAFQKAKLAFEQALTASGLTYSIVRPTAFFKSLSGQVARVQNGKPFLVFGDGTLTSCKPISDRDLGTYLALCLSDTTLHNRILPIGGPGPAITPRDQAALIFEATGMSPKIKSMPVWVMDAIIKGLRIGGLIAPKLRAKANLADIGRYYATESMLIWDGSAYDADATPSFGSDTLADHYRMMVQKGLTANLGDHAVF